MCIKLLWPTSRNSRTIYAQKESVCSLHGLACQRSLRNWRSRIQSATPRYPPAPLSALSEELRNRSRRLPRVWQLFFSSNLRACSLSERPVSERAQLDTEHHKHGKHRPPPAICDILVTVDHNLFELVESAWQQYDEAPREHIVTPSMPILFFGDLAAYERSPLRVVSVALNPSYKEFPKEEPFQRFPGAEKISSPLAEETASKYIEALSGYFSTKPYGRWFNPGFEPLLQGMGSSYYGGANVALHTDICSPLATSLTWSDLPQTVCTTLSKTGNELWHRLINRLDPDVMLISVKKAYRDEIKFKALMDWEQFHPIDRERPYHFYVRRYQLLGGKTTVALFGQAAQIPFGTVSGSDKCATGRHLLELIHV